MAGALKHMERSHRSYRANKDASIYANFHRRAYTVKNIKEQRKTLGQRLAGLVKKMLPKTTSK